MENTEIINEVVETTEEMAPEIIAIAKKSGKCNKCAVVAAATFVTAIVGFGAYKGVKFVAGKIKAKKDSAKAVEVDNEGNPIENDSIDYDIQE